MDILVVAPYCSLPGESRQNRFMAISQLLSDRGHNVTLVTSNFDHHSKKKRDEILSDTSSFKIKLLKVREYEKNVSIQRLLSIRDFNASFKSWFVPSYDVVYSAYPLISTNLYLSRLIPRKFKLILDVQDMWPYSFSSVLPIVSYIPSFFISYLFKINTIFSSADDIITVSNKFTQFVNKYRSKKNLAITLPIGSSVDVSKLKPYKYNEVFTLCYIGTLSYSYDMETVIKAVNKLSDRINIKLLVVGSGPDIKLLKEISSSSIFFLGELPYDDCLEVLNSSDVAVNPIVSTSGAGLTNKICDYLRLGIPILNSQESEDVYEYLRMVESVNYISGNIPDCIESIFKMFNNYKDFVRNPIDSMDRDFIYNSLISKMDL